MNPELIIFIICIYFLPTIIAGIRRHPQFIPIMVINIFLGTTGIFWIGDLVFALWRFK